MGKQLADGTYDPLVSEVSTMRTSVNAWCGELWKTDPIVADAMAMASGWFRKTGFSHVRAFVINETGNQYFEVGH